MRYILLNYAYDQRNQDNNSINIYLNSNGSVYIFTIEFELNTSIEILYRSIDRNRNIYYLSLS